MSPTSAVHDHETNSNTVFEKANVAQSFEKHILGA